MHGVATSWMWVSFSIFIIIALGLDAFLLHKRGSRPLSLRTPLYWSLIWISCALIFNALLWFYLYRTAGPQVAHVKALEFFTGYLIEKSLSVDNLFVFYMVFHQFRIPDIYQKRVFTYGIWGAIVMRLLLILLGTWLITEFHWILYIMGVFLLLTGIKMFFVHEKEKDIKDMWLIRVMKKWIRMTSEFHEEKFFIKKNNLWYATPLFLALIFIEFSDLVFAFDSIPAIFAITRDPFIIWTSNIFAILGLRALYFLLAGLVTKFYLLKYGIALILMFVGTKMVIEPWAHIPVLVSLMVISTILILFTLLSFWLLQQKAKKVIWKP